MNSERKIFTAAARALADIWKPERMESLLLHFRAYPISTKNDSAQFYFNQGLSMYYYYHWPEANASFREAARFDSGSAIAYWGQALALGPGYNFSLHYKMRKEVPAVIQLMNQHAAQASPKEKKLIDVMNLRYSADTGDSEEKL